MGKDPKLYQTIYFRKRRPNSPCMVLGPIRSGYQGTWSCYRIDERYAPRSSRFWGGWRLGWSYRMRIYCCFDCAYSSRGLGSALPHNSEGIRVLSSWFVPLVQCLQSRHPRQQFDLHHHFQESWWLDPRGIDVPCFFVRFELFILEWFERSIERWLQISDGIQKTHKWYARLSNYLLLVVCSRIVVYLGAFPSSSALSALRWLVGSF